MVTTALVGVCAGTNNEVRTEIAGYQEFKVFAGRADLVSVFLDQRSYDDFKNGAMWSVQRGADVMRAVGATHIRYSIPFPGPTKTAGPRFNAGDFDDLYISIAQAIVKAIPGAETLRNIIIRLPWEFNLNPDFQSQGAGVDTGNFRRAIRRMASLFRTVGKGRFAIEWCPAVGRNDFDPETVWPGMDYVDIVAQDIYFDSRWDRPGIFDYRLNEANGLAWGAAFAKSKNKQYALAEFGATDASLAPDLAKLGKWLQTVPHLHNFTIWDRADGPIATRVSDGARPEVATAYLSNFGLT